MKMGNITLGPERPELCYKCFHNGHPEDCLAQYKYVVRMKHEPGKYDESQEDFKRKYPVHNKYWCSTHVDNGEWVFQGTACKNCIKEEYKKIFDYLPQGWMTRGK